MTTTTTTELPYAVNLWGSHPDEGNDAHRARHAPRPDWPVDPETGRPICTTAQPMPPYAPGQWLHPEAVCTGSCSSGCCDDYECPACGTSWRTELPE